MPIHNLPDNLMTDEVMASGFKGIFSGGCVERGEGSSFRAKAHAHIKGKTPREHDGWICFRSAKRLNQHGIVIHELAHILTNEGHSRKFYECVRRLGGRIDRNDRRIAPVATRGL